MVYAVKWSDADHKGIVATTTLHDELVEKIIAIYGANISISVVDHADEADLALGEAIDNWAEFADINLDDDDIDDDIVGAAVAEMEAEDKAFVAAFYEKAIKEAFAKTRFNEHGLYIRAAVAPICVESQIELALYDINRLIAEISNHRDNHEAIITLPNGQSLTFKKFTGSRENGYMIGLVYIQVDNGTERKVRCYRTTMDWLEQMKKMPISALAQMNFQFITIGGATKVPPKLIGEDYDK